MREDHVNTSTCVGSKSCSFYWNADEGSQLYRNALQVLIDSKCMPLDDNVMEKMIDLPKLLYLVGSNGESSHVLRIFDDEAQAMQSARSSARML
ncbi:unnamed protein product [Camellia sinensis]